MSMGIPHQIGSIWSETTSDGCLDEAGKHISAQWKPPSGLNCRTQRPKIDFDMHSLQVSSPLVSPCSSSPSVDDWWRRPVYSPTGQSGGIRPDLSVACKAFEVQTKADPATDREAGLAAQFERSYEEEVHDLPLAAVKKHGKAWVPVFVMLPLDSINHNNTVNRRKALNTSLQALKSASVEGVMVDVWWGLVEREAPGQYNWSGYRELLEMVKKHGLKVQAVMSFHQCGGNVGDSANIPLPKWVVEEINRDNDLAYTDQWGKRNYEYISLGCDNLPVLKRRTPIQCYADYMRSFKETFNDLLGETIVGHQDCTNWQQAEEDENSCTLNIYKIYRTLVNGEK